MLLRGVVLLRAFAFEFCRPVFDLLLDLSAYLARLGQFFLIRALKSRGVVKWPVESLSHPGEISWGSSSQHSRKRRSNNKVQLAYIPWNVLGTLPALIDADLFHHLADMRVDHAGFEPGAVPRHGGRYLERAGFELHTALE